MAMPLSPVLAAPDAGTVRRLTEQLEQERADKRRMLEAHAQELTKLRMDHHRAMDDRQAQVKREVDIVATEAERVIAERDAAHAREVQQLRQHIANLTAQVMEVGVHKALPPAVAPLALPSADEIISPTPDVLVAAAPGARTASATAAAADAHLHQHYGRLLQEAAARHEQEKTALKERHAGDLKQLEDYYTGLLASSKAAHLAQQQQAVAVPAEFAAQVEREKQALRDAHAADIHALEVYFADMFVGGAHLRPLGDVSGSLQLIAPHPPPLPALPFPAGVAPPAPEVREAARAAIIERIRAQGASGVPPPPPAVAVPVPVETHANVAIAALEEQVRVWKAACREKEDRLKRLLAEVEDPEVIRQRERERVVDEQGKATERLVAEITAQMEHRHAQEIESLRNQPAAAAAQQDGGAEEDKHIHLRLVLEGKVEQLRAEKAALESQLQEKSTQIHVTNTALDSARGMIDEIGASCTQNEETLRGELAHARAQIGDLQRHLVTLHRYAIGQQTTNHTNEANLQEMQRLVRDVIGSMGALGVPVQNHALLPPGVDMVHPGLL